MAQFGNSSPKSVIGALLLLAVMAAGAYFGNPANRGIKPGQPSTTSPADQSTASSPPLDSDGSPNDSAKTSGDESDRSPQGAAREKNTSGPSTADKSNPSARTANPNTPPPSSDRKSDPFGKSKSAPITVDNVTIKDIDGKTVYRGTIELQPTLDRISQGKRLRFSHDGSTFENREGRLLRKGAGYYTEWIHLTPKISGPGPQRVVLGQQGEVYYTHDHYRTFKQLKQAGDVSANNPTRSAEARNSSSKTNPSRSDSTERTIPTERTGPNRNPPVSPK